MTRPDRMSSELQGRSTQDDGALPQWATLALILVALALIALAVGALDMQYGYGLSKTT